MSDYLTDQYRIHKDYKRFLREKYWALHTESMARNDKNKKQFNKIYKEIKKLDGYEEFLKDQQIIGKIIFVSWLLKEEGEKKIVKKVFKERGWSVSKDGNKILKVKKKK